MHRINKTHCKTQKQIISHQTCCKQWSDAKKTLVLTSLSSIFFVYLYFSCVLHWLKTQWLSLLFLCLNVLQLCIFYQLRPLCCVCPLLATVEGMLWLLLISCCIEKPHRPHSLSGLSPDLQSMEQIRRIMRPTDVPDTGTITSCARAQTQSGCVEIHSDWVSGFIR